MKSTNTRITVFCYVVRYLLLHSQCCYSRGQIKESTKGGGAWNVNRMSGGMPSKILVFSCSDRASSAVRGKNV